MSFYIMPVTSDWPHYLFETELEGQNYNFELRWFERDTFWQFSILDNDRTPIVARKLVLGAPILRRSTDSRLPPGDFVLFDTSGANSPPTINDLGTRVQLWYLDAETIESLFPKTTSEGSPDLTNHYQYILDCQRSTGAITTVPGGTNIIIDAAITTARALVPTHPAYVLKFLNWYVAHMEVSGKIFDWSVSGSLESSTAFGNAEDTYALGFLSLVYAYEESVRDTKWAAENLTSLQKVRDYAISLTDIDGLTWKKASELTKSTINNVTSYAGWKDYASLMTLMGNSSEATAATLRASASSVGIIANLYCPGTDLYKPDSSVSCGSINLTTFDPDAITQIAPLVTGFVTDSSGYDHFTAAWLNWQNLSSISAPSLVCAYASALAGDKSRLQQAYVNAGAKFPTLDAPWTVIESAWLIRAIRKVFS